MISRGKLKKPVTCIHDSINQFCLTILFLMTSEDCRFAGIHYALNQHGFFEASVNQNGGHPRCPCGQSKVGHRADVIEQTIGGWQAIVRDSPKDPPASISIATTLP
jgi:hypothetical protein